MATSEAHAEYSDSPRLKRPHIDEDIEAPQQLERLRELFEPAAGAPEKVCSVQRIEKVDAIVAALCAEKRLQADAIIGCGYISVGDHAQAFEPLKRVANAPIHSVDARDHISAIMMLMPMLREREMWVDIISAAEKTQEIAMGRWVDSSLPYIKGLALLHQKRLRDASSCFREAISLDRGFVQAYIDYDSVMTLLGDFKRRRQMAQRLVDHGGHWVNSWQRPQHFLPSIKSTPWHEIGAFDLARRLESNFAVIKREMQALLATELPWGKVGSSDRGSENSAHDNLLVGSGEWREVVLLGDASECAKNCERCPETARILESFPEVAQAASLGLGECLFSKLRPGTHLKPHCGPTNMRLTCHLGIDVPGGATITCGGETRTWEEGKCLVFDDSYEHEVTHNGDRDRIVLLVNFWHPATAADSWKTLTDQAYNRQVNGPSA